MGFLSAIIAGELEVVMVAKLGTTMVACEYHFTLIKKQGKQSNKHHNRYNLDKS